METASPASEQEFIKLAPEKLLEEIFDALLGE